MNRTGIFVAAIALFAAFPRPAHGQSGIEKRATLSGDDRPEVEMRAEPWVATRDVIRSPPGSAVLRSRVLWPGDFGSWAYAPKGFGSTPIALTAGETALTSRLSLVLEGAQDTVDRRFSGMGSGLRLHLLSLDAPVQLSLASGIARDFNGASGLWNQINVAHVAGRWRFVAALRAGAASGNGAFGGSGGVSVDLRPVRIGVEYAFDHGTVSRSAILGWIGLPLGKGPFMLRATAVAPLIAGTGYSIVIGLAANL
jgi:hypothetical protein